MLLSSVRGFMTSKAAANIRRSAAAAASAASESGLPVWVQTMPDGAVKVAAHVKPGAKASQVVETAGDAVGIQLAAPARDGEANQEFLRFMADTLGVRKHQLSLIAGHKSRDKVLRIESSMTASAVHTRLQDSASDRSAK
ncbi:hypothetical protein BC831DRAFT_457235 [Entophlyctis helioformis]|nr:hypothetical protein BC831DRAFT_457235 [Entophlyctis helioformis]